MFDCLCAARWQYYLVAQIVLILIIIPSQIVMLLPSHDCELTACTVILRPLPSEQSVTHKYYVPNLSEIWIDCETSLQTPWYYFDRSRLPIRNPTGVYSLNRTNVSEIKSLFINDTAANNGTGISCFNESHRIFNIMLNVFEPTKFQLRATDRDIGSVQIFWRQSKPAVMYHELQTLFLMIWNGTNTQSHYVPVTDQSYFNFTAPEGAAPCEVYNFSVTATYIGANYTGAGCSVSSPVLSRMLPSLPDIQQLESSLSYSLMKNDTNITLVTTFLQANYCEEYPIKNYTLLLNGRPPAVHQFLIAEENVSIEMSNLPDNSFITLQICVYNDFGSSMTNGTHIYTTDLQNVIAVPSDSEYTFLFGCDFIPGSNAQGCMVILVGKTDNITVNLSRNGLCAAEMIELNINFSLTNSDMNVVGYDIELNGSVGSLAVHGELLFNNTKLNTCVLSKPEKDLSPSTISLWKVIMSAGATVITVVLIAVIVLSCIKVKRPKIGVFRPSIQSKTDASPKFQLPLYSQPDKRGVLESQKRKEAMPLHDLHEKASAAVKKGVDDDTCHATSGCPIKESIINNNYAEVTDNKEHYYHILENTKKALMESGLIHPDPDAPELPPPFKPEPSPPPIYQDIHDLPAKCQ